MIISFICRKLKTNASAYNKAVKIKVSLTKLDWFYNQWLGICYCNLYNSDVLYHVASESSDFVDHLYASNQMDWNIITVYAEQYSSTQHMFTLCVVINQSLSVCVLRTAIKESDFKSGIYTGNSPNTKNQNTTSAVFTTDWEYTDAWCVAFLTIF